MSSNTDTATKADPNGYAFKAYIQKIYLALPNYTFDHHPIDDEDDEDDKKDIKNEVFLGREEITQRLVSILEQGDNRGAYLVTGYRGMGKTSYVRKALKKYTNAKKDDEKVVYKHISFAQNDLKEIDILRQITKFIKDELEFNARLRIINYLSRRSLIFFFACFIFFFTFFLEKYTGDEAIKAAVKSKDEIINNFIISIVGGLFIFQIIQFLLYLLRTRPSIKNLVALYTKIELLYDRCQGEISSEKGIDSHNEQLPLGFIDKKSKKYQSLTPKEAEHELIDILGRFRKLNFYELKFSLLNAFLYFALVSCVVLLFFIPQISHVVYVLLLSLFYSFQLETQPFFSSFLLLFIWYFVYHLHFSLKFIDVKKNRKQFIFVFDELDKLDPNTGKGYFYENIAASTNLHYNTYTNDLRERKQVVVGLLSSLKYFITEANARFIFIAGREMFDASLADIADRQSSISSIFHQVIYIESFYRDTPSGRPRSSGIGEMVESYLERVLIPSEFKQKSGNTFDENHFLGNYYQYLQEKTALKKEERLKIIFTLQNLIIYITYRSNGSPKKMVRLLEESIVNKPSKTEGNGIFATYKNNKEEDAKLYLKLSFKKQYKLGFTSYLFRPFFLMYGTFLKRYGDSLLVSTPYLIDNLIKFHPFAFSVKNLELLPEVISSNKTPELRLFIEELIFFLSQNHLRETESGLFEYKFYDKTHNEIAYISKIAEEESAAFNFTLDENFPIKRHLAARIKELRNIHKDFKNDNENGDNYSRSISFLNDLLGDAELYDDEFEDAIISYSDALQVLPKNQDLTIEQFVFTLRSKLKLGLTYEKMKSFDYALAHYSDALIQAQAFFAAKNNGHELLLFSPSFRELLQLATQSLAALIYVQEKLDEGLTFQKIAVFSQTFQGLLDSVGKTGYAGRDIIEANHYAQLGTIVFYKNMSIPHDFFAKIPDPLKVKELDKLFYERPLKINGFDFLAKSYEELNMGYSELIFPKIDHQNRDFRFSFVAYVYYKKCLCAFLSKDKQSDTLSDLIKSCFGMMFSFQNTHDKNLLRGIADVLTRLGDLLFTLYQPDNKTDCSSVLHTVRNHYNRNNSQQSIIARLDLAFKKYINVPANCFAFDASAPKVCLDDVLFLYYLSGRFYLKSGRSNSCSFQFRKILLAVRSFVHFAKNQPYSNSEMVEWLENTIFKKILEFSSWNNNSSDRPQILKFKDYIGIESTLTPPEYSKYIYLNLSNNPETKEALLLLATMKVKIADYSLANYPTLKEFMVKCPEQSLITPHNSISHQLSRIMELELQVFMNHKYLHEGLNDRWMASNPRPTIDLKKWETEYKKLTLANEVDIRDYKYRSKSTDRLLAKKLGLIVNEDTPSGELKKLLKDYFDLVANSIYCLHQIISILKVYGINHFLNNAYLGTFHQKMGDWLKHYRLCKVLNEELGLKFGIDETFGQLLGFRVIHALEVLPQYQLALQHYYRAIQVHSEGPAYKFQISNFIYLEDDYNDNLYHFGAALERQRVNSLDIRNRIVVLEGEAQEAGILRYDKFVNTEKFE